MLVLETPRLLLTAWRPENIDDLLLLHGDPQVTRYLNTDGKPDTRQQAQQRLATWADNFKTHRLGKLRIIRRDDGMFLGRAGFGLYPPAGAPELGYALRPEYWGNGYAREAATGLRDWFFRETMGDHFIGFADLRNAASLHILQASGMRPTHREPADDGVMTQFYAYRREDWHG